PVQTAAEVGPNPVQMIDRDTIEKSPERNTGELLRAQPVANANGVPTSGNAGNTDGQGASSISLRGFDVGATLVLIDGHRMVNYPSGTN
ncbi:Plug domain-containing protein, partial [Klebsiella pneumoniae]|uniref:Plug domain-containing protein n=1 Tax=Klebsiella pneumoniae TaxID=573 RepID=UPI003013AF0B